MSTLVLTEKNARHQQSFDREVVGLLDAICADLEITPAMFQMAKERYESIAGYLDDEASPLRKYRPSIYPHGSINTETTVKPAFDLEFDVDVICRLLVSERTPHTAFLDLIFDRLKQRGIYTLKRMNRCVRVQYANEFHIDITPGIPDVDLGPENILITDKELGRWKESNPKDYGVWFKTVANLSPKIRYAVRELMAKFAAAEPLPTPKFSKPMLNRIVQLMKRHRDIMFEGHKDAPISAIIATLAAESYAHHVQHGIFSTEVEFLRTVIADMPRFITRTGTEERVPNPKNPLENFADKWLANPQRKKAFHLWHDAAVVHLDKILDSIDQGKEALFGRLSEAYGPGVVKRATIKQAELRRAETESLSIGVTKSSGILAPIATAVSHSKPVLPVRSHTFFGA